MSIEKQSEVELIFRPFLQVKELMAFYEKALVVPPSP